MHLNTILNSAIPAQAFEEATKQELDTMMPTSATSVADRLHEERTTLRRLWWLFFAPA